MSKSRIHKQPDLLLILGTATDACRAAGAMLCSKRRSSAFTVMKRDRHDVKLTADRDAERAVIRALRSRRPMDGIIAEERGADRKVCNGVWIVDPLDGTVNYSHGHPHFCVSIAWAWQSDVIVSAVYDPLRNEMFTAIKGRGAWCNGKKIRTSTETVPIRSLLTVGFGKTDAGDAEHTTFRELLESFQRVRLSGSAALDLAYVACGRLDGYVESRVYLWDIAAGMLLVEEAGGRALSWKRSLPYHYACVASNAPLSQSLLKKVSMEPADNARTGIDDISG